MKNNFLLLIYYSATRLNYAFNSNNILINKKDFHRNSLTILESSNNQNIKIEDILTSPKWPAKWPFYPSDFRRQDESKDFQFYGQPRLVYHIDDQAVEALTKYYRRTFFPDASILDICSSWVSHFPTDLKLGRRVGLGMNKDELSVNKQLDDFVVQDLNENPIFPFPQETFDIVTCVVSVDYLTRPLEVFSEISRVLKPGGIAIISQSNRCFPSKAINIWLNTNDIEHVFIIGAYFHYSNGFLPAISVDISPNPGRSDPMFIIQATKKRLS